MLMAALAAGPGSAGDARAATAPPPHAAAGSVPGLPVDAAPYGPPVPGALTRRFDPPAVPWGAGHRGVDLEAAPGDEVRSPAAGVVSFAGVVVGRGVVTVRHPDGLRSSLEPVTAAVRAGDVVAAGDLLGTLEPGGTHLGVHWGVRDGEVYRDPLGLLPAAGPVVLLPTP